MNYGYNNYSFPYQPEYNNYSNQPYSPMDYMQPGSRMSNNNNNVNSNIGGNNNGNNNFMRNTILPNNNFIPLVFVNGVEGAKGYVMNANQILYLKDCDSDTLFIKSADSIGRCDLKAYSLTEIPIDEIGKPKSGISKEKEKELNDVDFSSFATKEEFKKFKNDMNNMFNNLSNKIEKIGSERGNNRSGNNGGR